MPVQFEDLLFVLCPGFELKHATDFQKHFLVSDEKEAKLAFDVLVSYGFDAKVYPSDDNSAAKLYITLPAADTDPAVIERRLLAAIAYGKALRDIKTRLDNLCHQDAQALNKPTYTLTFANAPQGGKQMVIAVNPAVASQPAAPVPAPAQTQRPATQPLQAQRPVMKKTMKKQDDDGFNQGPTVAKNLYAGPGKKNDKRSEDDWRRRAFLYVTGNIATGGAGMLAAVVVLFVLFSFFVLAKGFLCPDFAVEKKDVNRAWYCENPKKKEEDPNKPKLPELPTAGNIR